MKFIKKFFLYFFLLNIFLAVFFYAKSKIYIGGSDKVFVTYLNQNKQNIDLEKANFTLFDEKFYASNIFILSENHGYEDVQRIDDQLFIHLNKTIGVRFYIAEMDSTRAKKLNQYLNTPIADETVLKSVVEDIKMSIPQQSSQQLFDKWKRIYTYNRSLPDNARIEVLGLDQDFDSKNNTLSRDSSMLLNLKNIVEKRGLQNEKFYGLFGFYHGLQTGITEANRYPFAAKLRRSQLSFFKNVQTITTYTTESEMYLPKNDEVPSPPDEKTSLCSMDGLFLNVKGINDLKAASFPNSATLFKLDGNNSPYKKSQYLAGVKMNVLGNNILPNNAQQTTTDFFQYIILLRGTKALNPLK